MGYWTEKQFRKLARVNKHPVIFYIKKRSITPMEGITINGSFGEGGGQILRMSLVFSAVTGRPFRIVNIRANRPNPGLRRQHLGCVELAAQMTGAENTEVKVGTPELSFVPGKPRSGTFITDIGAGSITLLASVFLPIAMVSEGVCRLVAKGGTDVPFAPTSSYFEHAFLPLASRLFSQLEWRIAEKGFFPKGKGEAHFLAEGKATLPHLSFLDKGDHKGTSLYIGTTNLPGHISRRLCSSFQNEFGARSLGFSEDIRFIVDNNPSPDPWRVGVSACSVSEFDRGVIARSLCGKRGIPSERIGKKLASEHLQQVEQPCVDSFLADQLLPYIALLGGEISVREPTKHFLTGLQVSEKFLGKDYTKKTEGEIHYYSFRPWYRSGESKRKN